LLVKYEKRSTSGEKANRRSGTAERPTERRGPRESSKKNKNLAHGRNFGGRESFIGAQVRRHLKGVKEAAYEKLSKLNDRICGRGDTPDIHLHRGSLKVRVRPIAPEKERIR